MIAEFIGKAMKVSTYQHKSDTASSYYWQQGSRILPNRLSISKEGEMSSVQRKGRNLMHPITGQLLGKFKVSEESPLKQHKPFSVRTQIWQVPQHPSFIGYGTIGITQESGKVEDTGDLIVLHSTDQWEHITIYYFAGMGNPNDLPQVMQYLTNYINEKEKGNASQQIPSNGL